MGKEMTAMKRTRFVLLPVSLVLLLTAMTGASQDLRPLPTKVADILAQFPANHSLQRDRLAGEMLDLGEAGLGEFTRRLVRAGSGNDTAVRFALNSMAVYASRFGAEPQRALAEKSLINALSTASDPEVKTLSFEPTAARRQG